ncbi:MAG: HAD family hydrolase, partial [Lachnospiraceae bacterium]|nr:HAD family hydrolase [Lachnospiraceae bacterium]
YIAGYMTLQGAPYSAVELRKRYRSLVSALCRKLYEKHKDLIPELTQDQIEVDLSQVFSQLYYEKGLAQIPQMIADLALMFRAVSLTYLRLYEGAELLLNELRHQGKRIYLLSNAQRLFTEPELRSLGIYDLFDDVMISSDIGFKKPSPLFYDALIEKHSLDPKASVMIGNDWQADAWGAHNSGLASMYIHTVQSPELAGDLPRDCRRLKDISDVL